MVFVSGGQCENTHCIQHTAYITYSMWSWPQLQKRLLLTYDFTGTVECIHTHTHREPTCPGRHLYYDFSGTVECIHTHKHTVSPPALVDISTYYLSQQTNRAL